MTVRNVSPKILMAMLMLIYATALAPTGAPEPGECPIPAPEEFTRIQLPEGNLLQWQPPVLEPLWGITAYRIYRTLEENAPPSAYEFIKEVEADARQYLDDQVIPFLDYQYMMTAVGACGEGYPAFAPYPPQYPYCPPIQLIDDPGKPGGIDPQFHAECIEPPPFGDAP